MLKLKAIWSAIAALPRWMWAVLVLGGAFLWYQARTRARAGQRARIDDERHESTVLYMAETDKARASKELSIATVRRQKLARDQAIQERRNAIDDAERRGRAALLEQLDRVMLRRRERRDQ